MLKIVLEKLLLSKNFLNLKYKTKAKEVMNVIHKKYAK
jgi:hypothetical protein